MQKRVRSADIRNRKGKGKPFATITAYDVSFCAAIEASGIDVVLVGDSLGHVTPLDASDVLKAIEVYADLGSVTLRSSRAISRQHGACALAVFAYYIADPRAQR